MESLEERVVATVLAQYARLPAKFKPKGVTDRGVAEWVPLAGIAICKGEY